MHLGRTLRYYLAAVVRPEQDGLATDLSEMLERILDDALHASTGPAGATGMNGSRGLSAPMDPSDTRATSGAAPTNAKGAPPGAPARRSRSDLVASVGPNGRPVSAGAGTGGGGGGRRAPLSVETFARPGGAGLGAAGGVGGGAGGDTGGDAGNFASEDEMGPALAAARGQSERVVSKSAPFRQTSPAAMASDADNTQRVDTAADTANTADGAAGSAGSAGSAQATVASTQAKVEPLRIRAVNNMERTRWESAPASYADSRRACMLREQFEAPRRSVEESLLRSITMFSAVDARLFAEQCTRVDSLLFKNVTTRELFMTAWTNDAHPHGRVDVQSTPRASGAASAGPGTTPLGGMNRGGGGFGVHRRGGGGGSSGSGGVGRLARDEWHWVPPCHSTGILRMKDHFERFSRWVTAMIVVPDKRRDRVNQLVKLVEVGQQLRLLHNFNGLMALLAGIQVSNAAGMGDGGDDVGRWSMGIVGIALLLSICAVWGRHEYGQCVCSVGK